jgi:hypothetical protein
MRGFWSFVFLASCVFDSSGINPTKPTKPSDALSLDASVDQPELFDQDIDTSDLSVKPDLPKTKPDLPKPDLPKPDLPQPDLPVVQKTCTELYGFTPSFVLCNQTPTQCRFYTNTNQQSCTQICTQGGGTCISACEEGGSGNCNCDYSEPCSNAAYDQICTCTRP